MMTAPPRPSIIRRLLDEAPWLSDAAIADITYRAPQRVRQVRMSMGIPPAGECQRMEARRIVKGMR